MLESKKISFVFSNIDRYKTKSAEKYISSVSAETRILNCYDNGDVQWLEGTKVHSKLKKEEW